MIEDDLTYEIIGCAMKEHSTIGCAFHEVVYPRGLAIEMNRAGLSFGREVVGPTFYDGYSVGSRRADSVVGNQVVVALKALIEWENVHITQARNYVMAYGFDVGFLNNFGAESLDHKRILNGRKNSEKHPVT